MKKRPLGTSDLSVSELCLGTMNFGWKEPRESSEKRLHEFVFAGGNFIDTANVYSRREAPGMDFYGKDFDKYVDGTSERLIGEWVKKNKKRSELVIATKVGFAYPGIEIGTSAKQIKCECEKSLRRLQTDYVDLLYLHMDDRNTSFEESLYAMTELVKEGKVRYIGASNFETYRVCQAINISRANGFASFCCVQQRHTYLKPKENSSFGRQAAADDGLFKLAAETGIEILAYSPLLKGYYNKRKKELPEQYISEANEKRMTILDDIAKETGATPAQIVYYWLLNSNPSVIPVVGASSSEQFNEAMGALNLKLTDEQQSRLNR